jgi:arginine metabolism regulation protein II
MLIDLDQIDRPNINSQTLSKGPFSVFQTHTPVHEDTLVDTCMNDCVSLSSPEETELLLQSGIESPPSLLLQRVQASVYQNPIVGMLMDNYANNVANLLQPVFHPQNPYSSIYVPTAMKGSTYLLFGVGGAIPPLPPSHVAIFYSILAASAFHLRGPVDYRSQFNSLGMKFRTKAFQYVRKSLQEKPSSVQSRDDLYQDAVMAAILTLITTDVGNVFFYIQGTIVLTYVSFRSWKAIWWNTGFI